jgi:hypothetical protein
VVSFALGMSLVVGAGTMVQTAIRTEYLGLHHYTTGIVMGSASTWIDTIHALEKSDVCEGMEGGIICSEYALKETTSSDQLSPKQMIKLIGVTNGIWNAIVEEAEKEGAELLEPTTDKVVYSDGYEDEVYGFDIPVPAIDEEFDCALVGTKGKWYDHKVMVSNPVPGDDIHAGTEMDLEDGEYQAELTLEGGTGKATVESPAPLKVENGIATLTLTWSSPNYDYMIVDGVKYEPVNEEGNSVFEIPVKVLNEPFDVIGDTTAMSEPHEIEYKLTCIVD